MKSIYNIFIVTLLLTQVLAVPSAGLDTPCPEKTSPTKTPIPTPCATDKAKYTDTEEYNNNDKNEYTDADSKYIEGQIEPANYKEPMHPGARTFPENVNRQGQYFHGHNNNQSHGQGNQHGHFNGMNPPSPSPTPSRVPDAVPGSSISLENTDASAIGSNTLSMGAEEDSAAISGNTENGENTIFGAVQPGGAVGFLGSLSNIFGASPSPMI